MGGERGTDRTRRRWLAGATLAISAAAVVAHVGEVFEESELATIDWRFDVRGGGEAPSDVVIVAFDSRAVAALDQSWPPEPDVHAALISALSEVGASAIAYEAPYDRAADGDRSLIRAMSETDGLVLAFTQLRDGEPLVLGGAEALSLDGIRAGDARLEADDDGSIRRFDRTVHGVAFAVQAAEVALGQAVPTSDFGPEGAVIDYAGAAGTIDQVSAAAVIDGSVEADALTGRIVIVGPTAPSISDGRETPADSQMPHVEVTANVVATILDDFPLSPVNPAGSAIIVAAVCLVSALGAIRLSAAAGILASLTVGVMYLVLSQAMFSRGTILPVVAPLAGLAISTAAIIAINYVFAGIERRRVHAVFGRFVPAQVVRDVVEADLGDDGDLVRATSCDVTVLFSDIRGFTTYSEGRRPEDVLDILNDYLGAMTDIVIDNGGTLVNYMGDGIMAVFGAPEPDDQHADSALKTAVEMLGALADFNERRDPTGDGEGFRIGIGLNSGPVVAGNVGTVRRLEYTMIGDTVNTAARIEGMTKEAPGDVLVADSTVSLLSERPEDLTKHDKIDIRGRGGAVDVWALRSDR